MLTIGSSGLINSPLISAFGIVESIIRMSSDIVKLRRRNPWNP